MPRAEFTLGSLAERFAALEFVRPAAMGIATADAQAAAIARVLEFGSIAGRRPWPRPGPRTVLAVDPETGASVVVAAQAPGGFIRIHARAAVEELARELAAPAGWLDGDDIESHLSASVARAADAMLARIRAAVPRDSGRLAASLSVVTQDLPAAQPL